METKIKNIGRWCREKAVEELTATFAENRNLFIAEFTKLKVSDLEEIRKALRKNSGVFLVVKDSLASLAFRKVELDYLIDTINGQTGVILAGDDPVAVSKTLMEFGKKFSNFKIKGGIFNSQQVSLKDIKELSQLPPRQVLVARVCTSLKAPLSRLVYSLGLLNKFVLTLKNLEDKKKEG